MTNLRRALTIAGSDSGGGAGIQADLKTFGALGVFGMSIITAVTAQNTRGVQGVFELPPEFVRLQIDSVMGDLGADAVKLGMLSSAPIVEAVADGLRKWGVKTLVVDPVMVAKGGAPLLRADARSALIDHILPIADVVTPNLPEAMVLTGLTITSLEEMRRAAALIHNMGARNVVVKGGHQAQSNESVDVLYDGETYREFRAPRVATRNDHGTGCTFASAVAAGLAKGLDVPEAVRLAKEYVTAILRASAKLRLGEGHGPMDHFSLVHTLGSEK